MSWIQCNHTCFLCYFDTIPVHAPGDQLFVYSTAYSFGLFTAEIVNSINQSIDANLRCAWNKKEDDEEEVQWQRLSKNARS